MADEFGPWVAHDGQGCPVPTGIVVNVEWCTGDQDVFAIPIETANCPRHMTTCWHWAFWSRETLDKYARIIRYRVRKPRALQQLRDLAESLPAIADQPQGVPA